MTTSLDLQHYIRGLDALWRKAMNVVLEIEHLQHVEHPRTEDEQLEETLKHHLERLYLRVRLAFELVGADETRKTMEDGFREFADGITALYDDHDNGMGSRSMDFLAWARGGYVHPNPDGQGGGGARRSTVARQPLPPAPGGTILPGPEAAYVRMTAHLVDPTPPPTDTPPCEAPGCDRALTPAQAARGARACSAPCRARAHRERRRARRLAEIDAAVKTLLDLRAEIARG